jgi:hypothetical protein
MKIQIDLRGAIRYLEQRRQLTNVPLKVIYGRNDSVLQNHQKNIPITFFRDNGEELEFMIKDNILSLFKQLKEHEIQFIKHI